MYFFVDDMQLQESILQLRTVERECYSALQSLQLFKHNESIVHPDKIRILEIQYDKLDRIYNTILEQKKFLEGLVMETSELQRITAKTFDELGHYL